MSNKTWLAAAQAPAFDLDLTMADIMWDLDPGWQQASQWYDDVPASRTPATAA